MTKQRALPAGALLVTAILLLTATVPSALGAGSTDLDPRLLEELAASPEGVDFLVFLDVQADLSAATVIEDRVERGRYVYDSLRAVAEASQARLRADLDKLGVPYHPFYIVNAIRVTGDEALARQLATRPEVARVVADPAFDGLDDPPPGPPGPEAVDAVGWNVSRVNADDAWDLGYTGQNIVVASCDTGVQWNHPALVSQYRGGPAGDHDYNWFDVYDDSDVPIDPNGHGTHTTGTMVGDDGGSNQIGVAPGAQWIACKVNSGSTWQASAYIACWEWFLAPTRVDGTDPDPAMAPHVVNNSWSCPESEGCQPDTLRPAAQALYAAGIAIAKSGGNSGSGCGTITNPGQYPELLATGSFDSSDNVSSFSSRGPVSVDGGTLIKPDIAAPGSGVRSAYPTNTYASLSGTSMAAPHTAGVIALLWSAHPALTGNLTDTFQIVLDSAEPRIDLQCVPNDPSGRPNNVWGWGIIDAQAAVQLALAGATGELAGTVTDADTTDPLADATVSAQPFGSGEAITFTTDITGEYAGVLDAGWYTVTAGAPGYRPSGEETVPVVSGTVTVQDFALERTEADLWITTTIPSHAIPGALLTYTLDFGSAGPDPVPWIEIRDRLNPWVDYVSSAGGAYDDVDHIVLWNIYDLPAGHTGAVTLVVHMTDTVEVGWDICNFARVRALGADAPADPRMSDNRAEVCTTVVSGVQRIYLPIVVRGY